MNLYCVEIVCAYPDYKRPYVSTRVYHFLTIQEANEKRREEKKAYYEDFLSMLEKDSENNEEVTDIDAVDEERLFEYIYADAYMDMEPFSANLYQISINDGTITSECISFPPSESLEGC